MLAVVNPGIRKGRGLDLLRRSRGLGAEGTAGGESSLGGGSGAPSPGKF